jgi:hypothetical protein
LRPEPRSTVIYYQRQAREQAARLPMGELNC